MLHPVVLDKGELPLSLKPIVHNISDTFHKFLDINLKINQQLEQIRLQNNGY